MATSPTLAPPPGAQGGGGNIAPTPGPNGTPSGSGGGQPVSVNLGLAVGLPVVLLLLVVGIIVAVLLWRRHRSKKADIAAGHQVENGSLREKKKQKILLKAPSHDGGELYVVRHFYAGEDGSEFKLQTGRIVQILEQREDGWCRGQVDDMEGWFPKTYVRKIEVSETVPEENKAEQTEADDQTDGMDNDGFVRISIESDIKGNPQNIVKLRTPAPRTRSGDVKRLSGMGREEFEGYLNQIFDIEDESADEAMEGNPPPQDPSTDVVKQVKNKQNTMLIIHSDEDAAEKDAEEEMEKAAREQENVIIKKPNSEVVTEKEEMDKQDVEDKTVKVRGREEEAMEESYSRGVPDGMPTEVTLPIEPISSDSVVPTANQERIPIHSHVKEGLQNALRDRMLRQDAVASETKRVPVTPSSYLAVHEYRAVAADQLSLCRGDVVLGEGKEENGWIRGRVQGSGDMGWFPKAYVRETRLLPGGDLMSEESDGTLDSEGEFDEDATGMEYRAVFAYSPQQDGDLPLNVGDHVIVMEMLASGWWRGYSADQEGWFPGAYVEPVPQDVTTTQDSGIHTPAAFPAMCSSRLEGDDGQAEPPEVSPILADPCPEPGTYDIGSPAPESDRFSTLTRQLRKLSLTLRPQLPKRFIKPRIVKVPKHRVSQRKSKTRPARPPPPLPMPLKKVMSVDEAETVDGNEADRRGKMERSMSMPDVTLERRRRSSSIPRPSVPPPQPPSASALVCEGGAADSMYGTVDEPHLYDEILALDDQPEIMYYVEGTLERNGPKVVHTSTPISTAPSFHTPEFKNISVADSGMEDPKMPIQNHPGTYGFESSGESHQDTVMDVEMVTEERIEEPMSICEVTQVSYDDTKKSDVSVKIDTLEFKRIKSKFEQLGLERRTDPIPDIVEDISMTTVSTNNETEADEFVIDLCLPSESGAVSEMTELPSVNYVDDTLTIHNLSSPPKERPPLPPKPDSLLQNSSVDVDMSSNLQVTVLETKDIPETNNDLHAENGLSSAKTKDIAEELNNADGHSVDVGHASVGMYKTDVLKNVPTYHHNDNLKTSKPLTPPKRPAPPKFMSIPTSPSQNDEVKTCVIDLDEIMLPSADIQEQKTETKSILKKSEDNEPKPVSSLTRYTFTTLETLDAMVVKAPTPPRPSPPKVKHILEDEETITFARAALFSTPLQKVEDSSDGYSIKTGVGLTNNRWPVEENMRKKQENKKIEKIDEDVDVTSPSSSVVDLKTSPLRFFVPPSFSPKSPDGSVSPTFKEYKKLDSEDAPKFMVSDFKTGLNTNASGMTSSGSPPPMMNDSVKYKISFDTSPTNPVAPVHSRTNSNLSSHSSRSKSPPISPGSQLSDSDNSLLRFYTPAKFVPKLQTETSPRSSAIIVEDVVLPSISQYDLNSNYSHSNRGVDKLHNMQNAQSLFSSANSGSQPKETILDLDSHMENSSPVIDRESNDGLAAKTLHGKRCPIIQNQIYDNISTPFPGIC